jgi:magnesium chelatase subunit D
VALSADTHPLSVQQRVEAVIKFMDFCGARDQKSVQADQELKEALANEEDLKITIMFAREYIHNVTIAPSQLQYLCEEGIRAGYQESRKSKDYVRSQRKLSAQQS